MSPARGAQPVSVTVVIPPLLQKVMDGRQRIHLGVPPGTGVGEVVDTLLRLYPKLASLVESDRAGQTHALSLALQQRGALGGLRLGLLDGDRLFLSAQSGKRLGQS